MLLFPQFNPVAIQLGPVAVHWYGLAYVAALLLGLFLTKRLARRHPAPGITPQTYEDLFVWVVLGVILGGRLGYILFYNPLFYLHHPLAILQVWQGGMSFHGGLLGVTAALCLFAWRRRLNVLHLADRLAPSVPIGLLFGRLANFINGELVGRPADPNLPWAMVFPHVDLLPRHPSQLYAAALEGLALALILWFITRRRIVPGQPVGVFLVGYALARFVGEFFRTPEITHAVFGLTLTQGQLLCLPMAVAGMLFLTQPRRRA